MLGDGLRLPGKHSVPRADDRVVVQRLPALDVPDQEVAGHTVPQTCKNQTC